MNSTVRNVLLGWEGRRETSALFRILAIVLLMGSSPVHAALNCPSGQTEGWISQGSTSFLALAACAPGAPMSDPPDKNLNGEDCFAGTTVVSGGATTVYSKPVVMQPSDRPGGGKRYIVRSHKTTSYPPESQIPDNESDQDWTITIAPGCVETTPNQCSSDAGVEHDLGGAPSGAACHNGCKVTAKAGSGFVGVCFGASCTTPVRGNGKYVGTGEACPAGGSTLTSDESCQTVNGKSVCTSPDKPNCIKINGVSSCFSSAGDICDTPECFAGGEEFLKRPDGSEIAKETTGTPPAPDNGTPGQRAEPDMQIGVTQGTNGTGGQWGGGGGGTSSTGRYDWWSPATAGESTTNEGEECDPQTEQCEGEGECGEEGQPACDEDMPDPNDWDAPDFDQDEARQKLEDAAKNNPLANIDFGNVAPSFSGSGGCQSISYPFFGGKTIVLPGPQGCGFLSVLKTILAWFLAVATAWTCFQRFTETI